MTAGSRLSCYGIPGDGCGGDREFVIEDETLFALDPITKERIVLFEGIKKAKAIEKKGCDIIITTQDATMIFNLSTLSISH